MSAPINPAPRVPQPGLTRRRTLRLLAGVSGLGLTACLGGSVAIGGPNAVPAPRRWRGIALGAQASLTIHHPNPAKAGEVMALALAEIARLERIFSLYRQDSALVRLNAKGRLDDPPLELVALLDRARLWSERTAGAFDVTVQPLWSLYRDHFAAAAADPTGPTTAALAAAQRLVDYRAVAIEARRIVLLKPGMAITLNGIAQGYITDRVADLLRTEGLESVLIDLGEIRGLGKHPAGEPWRVGIADPLMPERLRATLRIADQAVATSATTGMQFDAGGQHHHLLNPRTARPSAGFLAASVVAKRACDADACSTAILASEDALAAILGNRRVGVEKILTISPDGSLRQFDPGL
jgi:thiamine biosynthesis lipoprotein